MKLLLDFFPIILFFVTYKWAGSNPETTSQLLTPLLNTLGSGTLQAEQAPILAATVVAIVVSCLQALFQKLTGRKVDKIQLIGLGLIIVFGGATLLFQNENFIKWKPTILYWLTSLIFLIAYWLKKNPVELMLKAQVNMKSVAWSTLLYIWVVFFTLMGFINLAVAYLFSTEIWVNFKLFGTLGATLIFVVVQGIYMNKHIIEPDQNKTT